MIESDCDKFKQEIEDRKIQMMLGVNSNAHYSAVMEANSKLWCKN